MIARRHALVLFAISITCLSLPQVSMAQADRPTLRLVVGLAPGGSHDITARALAERLREILNMTVVVENKPGAGQRLALNEVKRSAPDGRTLLVASNSPFVIFPHTFNRLDYDPVKDFSPIARLMVTESALATGPKVPVANMKEFVAWAKANSKLATFGTPGAGTLPHFVGIMLGKSMGVDLVHVPYKGGAPAMIDFQGGHLPIIINSLADMLEGHRAGKFRVIASTGPKRSPLVPDVPTLQETGVDIVSQGAVWVYGPAGMTSETVNRMNAALVKSVSMADFQERFTKYGMTVAPSTPAELAAMQAEELKRWEGPVKASGFKED
ncbi:MAG: ABC transporter substrate-binding protein [Betaproteobacteria bacterium]|nr:ABC transporter substrate-binding protein [Betaproteobacteria bacterium]